MTKSIYILLIFVLHACSGEKKDSKINSTKEEYKILKLSGKTLKVVNDKNEHVIKIMIADNFYKYFILDDHLNLIEIGYKFDEISYGWVSHFENEKLVNKNTYHFSKKNKKYNFIQGQTFDTTVRNKYSDFTILFNDKIDTVIDTRYNFILKMRPQVDSSEISVWVNSDSISTKMYIGTQPSIKIIKLKDGINDIICWVKTIENYSPKEYKLFFGPEINGNVKYNNKKVITDTKIHKKIFVIYK